MGRNSNPADWSDKSINQPDIIAAQDPQFVKTFQKHDIANPHPKYGKDENILNPFGHTLYPKMVYPNGNTFAGVVVQNSEEEAAIMGNKPDPKPIEQQQQKNTW